MFNISDIFKIPTTDPTGARRQKLLNIMLLASGLASLLILIVTLLLAPLGLAGSEREVRRLLLASGLGLLVALGAFLLSRYISRDLAATLFLLLLSVLIALSDEPIQVAEGRTLLAFAIPILAASVVLRPWASFAMATMCSLIVVVVGLGMASQDVPNIPGIVLFYLLGLVSWMSARSLEREQATAMRNASLYEQAQSEIAARKRAEEALRESEQNFRDLVDNAPDGIIIADEKGAHLFANRRAAEITGYSVDELQNITIREMTLPEELDMYRERYRERIEGKPVPRQYERLIVRKDGTTVLTELTTTTTIWKGKACGMAIVRDITERKRAEEALRESEERYRTISELTSDWTYSFHVESDGSLVLDWMTDAATRIAGFTLEDVRAHGWQGGIHPDDLTIAERKAQTLLSGEPAAAEYRIITKSGEIRWVYDYGQPVWDEAQGRVVRIIGATQDITERRQLEEQLRQAVKMEAVGQLAGGVAHDFNNLLTIINGYSSLALDKLNRKDPLHHDLAEINEAGRRAADLTRQLLAFSRRQILRPQVLNLNEVLKGMTKMLGRLIGEDVQLVLKPANDLGNVKADPGQMEQVVLNIAVNARDAMPTGGTLIIETANVKLGEAYAARHPGVEAGNHVMLAINDTGHGMTPEVRERIFEPFFTTKEAGKGTGLGLSTVYGIVRQSGGGIHVYSEPGRGTTFRIYLPRVGEEPETESAVEREAALPGGTETILLVEDDDAVRGMAVRILQELGYKVLTASDGAEALELCRDRTGPLDLLLTDVVMPGMSGRDLAEQLQGMFQGLRVLYMSGYTDEVVGQHGVLQTGQRLVQKPFDIAQMARQVRQALDEPGDH